MGSMFRECSSLRELNLSNFNTKNVNEMNNMFGCCDSLKNKNVITNDNNILNKFGNDGCFII